ncbi:tRNA-intron lyase [Infirmifilum lucidum]|uniref:tRNA-intron lyase n=1 Tax=Infirmifilum lucidum TaxID=2776706 RepID=A0A7L9FIV9_9CREN|nr:tRNA-intron lyase [Infirmifilum lucidum]
MRGTLFLSNFIHKNPLCRVIRVEQCEKIRGVLLGGRVVIFDREKANALYFRGGFFGRFFTVPKPKTPDVKKELELSLFDAVYLAERGCLEVLNESGEAVSIDALKQLARRVYENFDDAYAVYKDLRGRGYVVKSGMKFGSTFAVYKLGPGIDHAPFLVHVLNYDSKLDPLEIIRAGRLSHSVKKKFILAYRDPIDGKIRYFVFKWFM